MNDSPCWVCLKGMKLSEREGRRRVEGGSGLEGEQGKSKGGGGGNASMARGRRSRGMEEEVMGATGPPRSKQGAPQGRTWPVGILFLMAALTFEGCSATWLQLNAMPAQINFGGDPLVVQPAVTLWTDVGKVDGFGGAAMPFPPHPNSFPSRHTTTIKPSSL